jgi:opacity protein-like surface antigen
MKKLSIALVLLLAAGAGLASAQVVPGKFELGASASYYNLKFSGEPSMSYLNVPVRFGWYAFGGLEIEPEVQVFIPMGDFGGDTGYQALAKLLYNFRLAGGLEPFIGAGVGGGNGIPYVGIVETSEGSKSLAYLGLLGLKIHVGNSAAFRIEYRFNRISWETDYSLGREWATLNQVLVGISLFL